MAKKREVRCKEFDVNTCTIERASKGEQKKHGREYHSKNSAVGSRKGFYNVVITRDFSKTPPYYYCTGNGCKAKTNRLPSMKDHIPKCRFIQWTAAQSTTASTLISPQSVPTASQPPSNSHQPTRTTKRKATDMASSTPSSALPPAEVDMSTSLLRSVSPAASQTSVFQSLATQLELYMKSTDSALFNSQTTLAQSQIILQQSNDFLATTTAYRSDINAKWENLTDQLALQATQQLAIQDAVGRISLGSSLAIAKMLRRMMTPLLEITMFWEPTLNKGWTVRKQHDGWMMG